jgi:hypothetical protein
MGFPFTISVNPCEPKASRLGWSSAPQQLQVFNPQTHGWQSFSGDVDPDHAYKIMNPGFVTLACWGAEPTVDQKIALPSAGTVVFGTGLNHGTHTSSWHLQHAGETKTLVEAVTAGWIQSTMYYYDAVYPGEHPFDVATGHEIGPGTAVRMDTLVNDITLVVPRTEE